MEDKTSELLEALMKEHPTEQIVAALNTLAGLSKEELQGVAELAQIIEGSPTTF